MEKWSAVTFVPAQGCIQQPKWSFAILATNGFSTEFKTLPPDFLN
jgi:hypothetical protein